MVGLLGLRLSFLPSLLLPIYLDQRSAVSVASRQPGAELHVASIGLRVNTPPTPPPRPPSPSSSLPPPQASPSRSLPTAAATP